MASTRPVRTSAGVLLSGEVLPGGVTVTPEPSDFAHEGCPPPDEQAAVVTATSRTPHATSTLRTLIAYLQVMRMAGINRPGSRPKLPTFRWQCIRLGWADGGYVDHRRAFLVGGGQVDHGADAPVVVALGVVEDLADGPL